MCKKRPGIVTRAQPSCMIGEATTPRRQRAFLRLIDWFRAKVCNLIACLRAKNVEAPMTVTFGQCGEPIVAESPDGDPAARNPCPKCGSRSRNFGVALHETASATATVDATVVTYPQNLLTLARQLSDEGRYGIAVV